MKNVKIIDCTLRDGGYYNNWDFSQELVDNLINSLGESGIDIVEIGYKSQIDSSFLGLYRYCTENQLQFLKQYKNVEFAFMLDVKDFLNEDGKIKKKELEKLLLPEEKSLFTWCRVASHYNTLNQAKEIITILYNLGYKTTLNLMGISLLNDFELQNSLMIIKKMNIEVFYFADSLGSFMPEEISNLIQTIKMYYDGSLGIHAHDNLGLAFANTLVAMKEGVEYIDATVKGMGRGAGNLQLEKLLLTLYFKYDFKHLNPYAILDVLDNYFLPLEKKFQWGEDFSYILSGLKNIHPSYCQSLKSTNKYKVAQVANIINSIPTSSRVKYDQKQLIIATNKAVKLTENYEERIVLKKYMPADNCEDIIIIGAGKNVEKYKRELILFLTAKKLKVFECNNSQILEDIKRTTVSLNEVRYTEVFKNINNNSVECVITGIEDVPTNLFNEKVMSYPFEIENKNFKVINGKIVIPAFNVGMYAIGLATLLKPKRIYLAGFDGYKEGNVEHVEMEQFFELLEEEYMSPGMELFSILPTNYNVPIKSIYYLLNKQEGVLYE